MTSYDTSTVEQVTAGIDWLTMTVASTVDAEMAWYMKGLHLLSEISDQGYEHKPRAMLGYYGYSCGNCFVGERVGSIMMQFTGHHADTAFHKVYRPDAHISRIDLQVTVKYIDMPKDTARKAYNDADAVNRKLPVHRRRKLYIIMGSDGGDTLYIGSPKSEQRGRLYNKEVQSEVPDFIRTWRYELVLRNDYATAIASNLGRADFNPTTGIAGIVSKWYSDRGILCAHFFSGEAEILPIMRTLPTDIESKLRWIATQVRPTVKLLIERGLTDELSEALGLVFSLPGE